MLSSSPPRSAALRRVVSSALPASPPRVARSFASCSPSRLAAKKKAAPAGPRATSLSLTQSHPSIAAQWTSAGTNSLTNANQVDAGSVKLIGWTCTHCKHVYKRRVRDQVLANGECPKCHFLPRTAKAAPKATTKNATKPAATSVSDDGASGVVSGTKSDALAQGKVIDPMLAQNWEQWAHLVPESEELLISPKLDGVRCVRRDVEPKLNLTDDAAKLFG